MRLVCECHSWMHSTQAAAHGLCALTAKQMHSNVALQQTAVVTWLVSPPPLHRHVSCVSDPRLVSPPPLPSYVLCLQPAAGVSASAAVICVLCLHRPRPSRVSHLRLRRRHICLVSPPPRPSHDWGSRARCCARDPPPVDDTLVRVPARVYLHLRLLH